MASNYETFKTQLKTQPGYQNFVTQPYNAGSIKDPVTSDWDTQDWQDTAWSLYEQLGEVHFAAEYFGNAMSQACIVPGVEDNYKVVELDTDADAKVKEVSDTILAQLTGIHHQLDQVIREIAISLFVVGEVWLVSEKVYKDNGQVAKNSDGSVKTILRVVPAHRIVSRPSGDGFIDKSHPEAEHDGFVGFQSKQTRFRIYRPDPRDPNKPTSNLQGVLHTGQTLLMLDRLTRGTIRSRTPAGILKIPSEITFGANPGFKGDGPSEGQVFTEALSKAMAEPIADEESAGSVVPYILRGSKEYLEGVELLRLDRGFDEYVPEIMTRYVRRLALGLDVPAEVLLGLGNANHWASWFISAEFVRLHAKPMLSLITGQLTKKLLHPALEREGVENWEKYCFTFDELGLVVQANKSSNARDAYRDGVISAEAYRHHLGFRETDAPEPGEVADPNSVGRDPIDVENPEINPIQEDE